MKPKSSDIIKPSDFLGEPDLLPGLTARAVLQKNLTWAREYARRWPVLALAWVNEDGICGCKKGPECPHTPGKHPLVRRGAYGATQDEDTIIGWWRNWPLANIGIQTGSDLLVVDVDPRNGGEVSLDNLLSRYGKLPPTPVCATGGGGWHYYFAHPDITTLSDGVQGYPGIDIKKWGGYIIAPPSRHFLGGIYRWLTDWRMPLAPVPGWLLKLIPEKKQVGGHGKVKARKVLADPIEPAELTQKDYKILRDIRAGRYGRIYQLLEAGCREEAGNYRKAGPYKTPSHADLALMNKLALITRDAGRTKALFLETELAKRDKVGDREDYVDITVLKAMDGRAWRPTQE